jgi:Zinc finger, C2H2 type
MSEICEMCGATFGSPADLMSHVQADHKDADPASDIEMNPEAHTRGFLCAMCGRRFPTPAALAAHNLEPHSLGPRMGRGRPFGT